MSEQSNDAQHGYASSDSAQLLQLPFPIIISILQQLSVTDLCAASRTCCILSKLAAHSSLWPSLKHHEWATWDVRCTLARTLHIPPQVFSVQLDVKRSRKFPITVPLHNLRPILNITDTEGLADRVSKAVQDQVSKLSASLWRCPSWQQYPPGASISICRADRATVRASLRPGAVVPVFVHHLQQAGWPPQAAGGSAAAVSSSAGHHGASAGKLDRTFNSRPLVRTVSATPAAPPFGVSDSDSSSVAGVHQGVYGASDAAPTQQLDLGSSSGAWLMMECLQECRSRLALLADGQLPQLQGFACNATSCSSGMLRAPYGDASPGSCEPRERLAALQLARLLPPRLAEATIKMPDWQTAESAAASQLTTLGMTQQAAEGLAPAAVRLLYLGAAADPSEVTFSLPGKPGWLMTLQKACKAVYRLHVLQQTCCCEHATSQQQHSNGQFVVQAGRAISSVHQRLLLPPEQVSLVLSACSSHMQRAWSAAAGAELQLCLAGLQEFSRVVASSKCSPATLFQCLITLESAATEYAEDVGGRAGLVAMNGSQQQEQENMTRLLHVSEDTLCIRKVPLPQELVRCAMHIESLRSLSWVLWLLGSGTCDLS